jgi:DNA-binding beta-propeller fold protein YncE
MLVALPPHAVAIYSRFDYVTVDVQRQRVYAAHTGSQTLLVTDGVTGAVLGQVSVGPMHGVAVDPASGMVYTGDGTDKTISEVDPVALKVLRSVSVPGQVDGMAYDPQLHRLYADQDNGSHVFVVDTRSMTLVKSIEMPSSDLEAMAIDPATHVYYQNLADKNAIAVVDPRTLTVTRVIPTREIHDNHPLVFDAQLDELVVGGKNGIMATYTPSGEKLAEGNVQPDIDQCSIGQSGDLEACAGHGVVTLVKLTRGGAPRIIATYKAPPKAHTVGIDEAHRKLWIVYPSDKGDFIQALRIAE